MRPFDEWVKDVAPSTDLRRWYGHDPAKFEAFAARYRAELATAPARDGVARLRARAEKSGVVLLTATRDVEHSAAAVLLERTHRAGTDARALSTFHRWDRAATGILAHPGCTEMEE